MKNSIKYNYILNTSYQILIMIVPLITTPYISRVLGADGIGIYSYTYSIVSYFVLVAVMGTSTFGQRTIAYYQEDKERRSRAFYEILIFRVISTLSCVTIYLFYLFNFVQDNKEIAVIQLLYLISVLFDVTWFFQGLEDFKTIVFRNALVKIINIVLIFALIKTAEDVWKYTLLLSLLTLVGNLSIWIYLPKYINKISVKTVKPFSNFKEILALFIPAVAVQIYTVLDKTMLGISAPSLMENGYYEQTEKIVRLALAIVTSLGTVMIPRIAKVFADKNYSLMKEYLKGSFQFVWLLGIPLLFGIAGTVRIFVPVFFGSDFEKIKVLLPVYSLIIIPVSLSNVIGCQFLIPTKQQKIYTFAVVFSAILNYFLNSFLIPRFFSLGAAAASVSAECFGALFMIAYTVKRGQIDLKVLLISSWKNWLSAIGMFVILLLLQRQMSIKISSLIVLISVGIVTYIVFLFLLKDDFFMKNVHSLVKKHKW
ncbi:oligosaccharide flippase family protein [uncultured Clostridium sp.]|uniref:oligosaccharide flippase family protein n=1 Tax=uncultured Clostridium sp. TaxID=59620 RepID=UPI0025E954F6|nr:oligosaccharide flippase family protein [uncultured Clostridium sp.]